MNLNGARLRLRGIEGVAVGDVMDVSPNVRNLSFIVDGDQADSYYDLFELVVIGAFILHEYEDHEDWTRTDAKEAYEYDGERQVNVKDFDDLVRRLGLKT